MHIYRPPASHPTAPYHYYYYTIIGLLLPSVVIIVVVVVYHRRAIIYRSSPPLPSIIIVVVLPQPYITPRHSTTTTAMSLPTTTVRKLSIAPRHSTIYSLPVILQYIRSPSVCNRTFSIALIVAQPSVTIVLLHRTTIAPHRHMHIVLHRSPPLPNFAQHESLPNFAPYHSLSAINQATTGD